jgi:hypothetical protein
MTGRRRSLAVHHLREGVITNTPARLSCPRLPVAGREAADTHNAAALLPEPALFGANEATPRCAMLNLK